MENSMFDILDSCPKNEEIANAYVKAYSKIHGYGEIGAPDYWQYYKRIMVSISGGSDSDIMLDMIERIGYPPGTVTYVFFDTGMEFEATKRHLDYLEYKYNITIDREKAVVPVPLGVRKYGIPFLSKLVSEYVSRLQRHDFKWEDAPFEELYAEYPKCRAALRWWCNQWGDNSRINIANWKGLKEFMISNPPTFPISCKCCDGAKKRTAHLLIKKYDPDLNVQGVRKAEGGARAAAYKGCFDDIPFGCDNLRPIFWFGNADKVAYEKAFSVTHSECYTLYGLPRTGCACCPYGSNFENELRAAEQFEPKLYKAAVNVFGKSYEYTRKYREFKETLQEGGICS